MSISEPDPSTHRTTGILPVPAAQITRDIAKKIDQDLTYPGEIKVTLIREVRAVEYAR